MKNLKIVCTVFCLLIMANSIFAQRACDRWYFDANYTFLQPIEILETNGFRQVHGASFGVYYNLNPYNDKITFHLGGRINGGVTKGIRDNITLADPEGAIGKTSVYNSIADFEFVGRAIFLPQQRIKPYAELFGGLRLTAAHETLELNNSYVGYEDKTSTQVISEGSGVVGGGIGALIKITDIVDFELRLTYSQAKNAEYVDLDSYLKVNDNLTYDFAKSESKNYGLHVGFRFKIGCGSNDRRGRRVNRNTRIKRKGKTPMKKSPRSSKG